MKSAQVAVQYAHADDVARVTVLFDKGTTFQQAVKMMWDARQSWGPNLWLVEGNQAFSLTDWGGMELRDGDLIVDMKDSVERPRAA